MFQLRKRYELEAAKGTISDAGIRQIISFIQSQNLHEGDWAEKNADRTSPVLPMLPEDWTWLWSVTGRGEYAGTLPRRISKFYYRVHSIRCPSSFLQEIGNIARPNSEDNAGYSFEFVNRFDWQAGDFGDDGSCFWDGRSGARLMLKQNSALAVRFYVPDRARAWLVPNTPQKGMCIIFNGYGFAGSATLTMARVVAMFLGMTYKRINLTNNYFDDGTLWINSGGGYAIGTAEQVHELSDYDFGWEEIDYMCGNCGTGVDVDEVRFGVYEEEFCADCFPMFFRRCEYCTTVRWIDNVVITPDEKHVCYSCLEENYIQCDNCDQYIQNKKAQTAGDDQLCESCYAERLANLLTQSPD